MKKITTFVLGLTLFSSLSASALEKLDVGVTFINGRSPLNLRGHSIFHSAMFDMTARSSWVERKVPGTIVGASISYSDITQSRSWFGYTYGDPDDRIRGEALQGFLRHPTHQAWYGVRPYIELGTGPMWSNRRVPAATSRLNFNSYLVVGTTLFDNGRWPVRTGYRFAHISNGGTTGRNPGLNVHSFFIGTTVHRFNHR